MQALRSLAERQSGDPHAALLAAAAVEPPEDAVYVINGQPVIVGWGRQGGRVLSAPPPATPRVTPPATPPATPPVTPPAAEPVPGRPAGFPWRLAGALTALALIAALAWWLWPLAGLGTGGAENRLAALAAEEATLTADIAAAEAELGRRLNACTTTEAAPPLPASALPRQAEVREEAPAEARTTPTPEPGPTAVPAPPPAPPKRDAAKPDPKKTEAEPAATPEPSAKAAAACPPPRKKWEAPELVLLLDASGSMRLKAGVSQEEIQALIRRARTGDRAALDQLKALEGGSGGDRLSAAKSALGSMLSSLPGDMDVGLVVFGQCKGAENHKFFSPAERPRLTALLDGIRPMEGTPLARGIERAGSIVDGRSVPATILVVTDGQDSCGRDPCAAARELKAAKPKVTINVVDVNGLGEGRCMAEATGGRVLPMTSPAALPDLIRKASGEQTVPPGCG